MVAVTNNRPRVVSPSGPVATAAFAALAVLVACSSFQPVLGAAKKPDNYKPIVDKAALAPGAQLLSWVPRWNRQFKMTSTDLGSFALFDCGEPNANGTTTGSCGVDTSSFTAEAAMNPPPNTIIDYGEGLAMWIAITVVGLVLSFGLMSLLICGRYCFCRCCCKPNGCTCLRGGANYPTRKQTCCGCGFVLLKSGKLGYTKCDRWGAKIYMVLFILCATALLVVAEFLGTQQIPTATVDGADAAAGRVMTLTTRTQPAITTLFKELGSTVVLPLLKTFNTSLTTAVDLSASHQALQCAQAMVLDLPDMATTSGILSTMMVLAPYMASNISTIQDQVQGIAYVKGNVTEKAMALKNDTVAFGSVKQPSLRQNILSIRGNTSLIQGFQNSYCDLGNGTTWKNDLNRFNRASTPTSGLKIPTAADFQTAASSLHTVVVARGTVDTTSLHNTDVATMNTLLVNIYNDLKDMPNFRTIGIGLQSVLDAQRAVQVRTNATANLLQLFADTPVLSASSPTTASITAKLTDLANYMANFDLAVMRRALVNVNETINGLPDLDFLLLQFDRLQVVKDVLPCVKRLGEDLASINRTVIGVPSSFSSVVDLYAAINSTVSTQLSSVETIRTNMLTTKTQIRSFRTWEYINNVDDAQAKVHAERNNLNLTTFTDFIGNMSTATDPSGAFDFTTATNAVLAFEAIKKDFFIDTVLIAALFDVQAKLDVLMPKLKAAAGSSPTADPDLKPYNFDNSVTTAHAGTLLLYQRGTCTNTPDSYCNSPAHCPTTGGVSNVCDLTKQGVSRCWISGAVCTTDFECTLGVTTSNDMCLTNAVRMAQLRDALYAFGDGTIGPGKPATSTPASVADPAAQQAQLLRVQDACPAPFASPGIDFSAIPTTMTNALAKLNLVVVSAYAGLVDGLASKMGLIDLSNVNSVLGTAFNNINSIDFTQSKGQVDALTAIIDDIENNKKPLVVSATSSVGALKNLMFQRWPGYQIRMQAMPMQNTMNIGGPGAGLQELVGVPQDIMTYLSENVDILPIPALDLLNTTALYAEYINRAFGGPGFKETTQNGGIYYLSQLALRDSTIRANDPNAKGVFVGKNGDKYPGDKLCLSKSCIQTTMNALYTGNIAAASSEVEMIPTVPIPLPLRWILLLLWAPIAIVILFGIWALFAPTCCRKPGWQKIPSAWVAGLSLCLMPIVMIISVLFFVAFMVAQDSCSSAQNVGANYLAASGDSLCGSTLGGAGGLGTCNFNLNSQLSSFGVNFNATISLLDTYAATLGSCNPDNDPYTNIINAIKPAIASIPPGVISYLMSGSLSENLKLGPAMRSEIDASAAQLGQVLAALMSDLNRISVKCSAISPATTGMQSDVCYTLFTPYFWYMICWYLVGWVLLFCGFPAGMLGRKRLPNGLWGRGYEEFRGTEREEIKSRSSKGSKSSAKVAPDSGVNVDDGVFRKSSSRSSSSKDKGKDDPKSPKSPSRSSSSSKDKDKDRGRSSSSSKDKDKSASRSSSSKDKDKDKSRSSSSSKSPSKSGSSSSSSSKDKDRGRSSSSSKDKEKSSSSSKSGSSSSSKSGSGSRSSSSKSPSKSGSSSSSSSKSPKK